MLSIPGMTAARLRRTGTKRTAIAHRGAANEANLQGWHEAGGGDRSVTGKAFALPARSREPRFLLESHPAVALRRDAKSLDRSHAPAQSSLAHDCEMDVAHA